MSELCDVIFVEDLRHAIEKIPAARVGAVGVIDGEEEAIDSDHFKGAAQWRQGEIAAGGAVKIGLEVIGDRLAKVRRGVRQDAAGAGERVGQAFPHVADNELQSGQAIEEAGDDEAEGMKAGLSVPAPARDGEKKAEFPGKAGIIGHADRPGRRRGMEIDRNSKMSGGLKDREEARIVKKKTIGGAIEESAVKSKACDTALQLSRRRGGRLQGQRGKSAKTGGMGTHRLGEFIVDIVGQRTRRIRIERIEAHRGEREHLEIDAGLIHVGNPSSAEVEELGVQFSKLRASSLAIGSGGVQEGLGNEVFFKRDGAHSRYDDARAPRVS